MLGLQVLAVIVSLLLLAAHFLRAGALLPVLVSIGMIGLLLVRRWWAARVIQVVLVLGALEWLRTMLHLAAARARAGEPATRMVVILGTVAAITLLSAAALSWGPLAVRRRRSR